MMVEELQGKELEELPKTEVVAKAQRRQYTAEYKLRILREVEACQGSGEIGALLRREGCIHRICPPGVGNGKAANWMDYQRINVGRR